MLKKDVRKVGRAGQVVEVSDGYARNLILPKGLGVIATAELVGQYQADLAAQKEKAEKHLLEARKTLEKLVAKTHNFTAKADEKGHLYAGLKESEILAKITGGEPSLAQALEIADYSPLKTVGEHLLTIRIASTNISKKIQIIISKAT